MNHRISSIYPPATGEYISPFTAPAMPNVRTLGSAPYKPAMAVAARIPRSPLSPQKLAKLANALGVSAPTPASGASPSELARSASMGRSGASRNASPDVGSVASAPNSSAGGSWTASSRYFVHVIPPKHFPHESRKDPEAFATFRRGSLVPVHATLQAQLGAIAREYQLPATNGLVLYLVADPEAGEAEGRASLGKGPRISEDVWKWLWLKVSEEQPAGRIGLGLSTGSSTPPASGKSLLRKLSSSSKLNVDTGKFMYPLSPSSLTSTGSTVAPESSDAKETSPLEPSASSQFSTSSTLSTAETPATSSFEFDSRLLSGLRSPSAIPVLAKIEFDIDRKAGSWYEKWRRSRRALQKRRTEKDESQGKMPLRIIVNDKKGTVSPLSSDDDEAEEVGYNQLSDSEPDEQETARISPRRGDPLGEVFGDDGDTWSEAQSARPRRKKKGDLALSGAELGTLPSPIFGDVVNGSGSDKEEVMALWNEQGQPQLDGSSLHPNGRGSHKPAPLHLKTSPNGSFLNITAGTPSPYASSFDSGSLHLPYLSDSDPKRLGGIYDSVELDLSDIDLEAHREQQLKVGQELDILERNLAQFSPRILKSVDLTPDLMPPDSPSIHSAPSEIQSFAIPEQHSLPISQGVQPPAPDRKRLVPTLQKLLPVRPSMMEMEEDFAQPPKFRQPKLVGTPSPDADSFKGAQGRNTASSSAEGLAQAAWPAVPYSALSNRSDSGPLSPTSMSSTKGVATSPPRLVLNGKYSESSKPVDERRKNSPSMSSILSTGSARSVSESLLRSKQYEEETGYNVEAVAIPPSLSRKAGAGGGSPVLPLSPDPFGRFPSAAYEEQSPIGIPPERTSSLTNGRESAAPSSRFSVDSVKEDPASLKVNTPRSTLVSMKSIRKLWRNKNKSSISGQSMPPSPDPSTMPSRPPSSAMSLQFSDANMSRTPSPSMAYAPTMQAPASGRTPTAAQQKAHKRPDSGLDPFYFDQDPRYPSRRSPSPEGSQYQFPGTPPPDAGSTQAEPRKRSSVRKSLIRRRNGGSDAGGSSSQSENFAGSVAGAELQPQQQQQQPRRRRPSLLDMASLMRGSVSSLRDARSPSVPELPAGYRQGGGGGGGQAEQHSRTQSRASLTAMAVLNSAVERERAEGGASPNSAVGPGPTRVNSVVRRKPAPQTQSSTDSSQESTDALLTPVSSVPPLLFATTKGSRLGRASPEDVEDAASFDESQFEIVSPRVDRFASGVAYD